MTRMLIIALFVIAAALLAETRAGNAQSPYSYPLCALYGGGSSGGSGGAMSCYYTSWEQCRITMSGSADFASRAHITTGKRHRCRTIR
jgi:hypothetical protein